MEVKGYEDRVKVYLRVVGDDALEQYTCALEIISRQSVRFTEPQRPVGPRKSVMGLEMFASRDKLAHTPPSCDPGKQAERAELDISVLLKTEDPSPVIHNFDYVFEPDESLEFVSNFLNLELGRIYCVISIGKADTLSSPKGLILTYLSQAFALGGEVSIGCTTFTNEKWTNWLTEPYQKVGNLQEVLTLTGNAEFFSSKKSHDGMLVFSVFHSTGGVQFVDVPTPSKALDTLLQVVTNSDSALDQRSFSRNRMYDVLRRTLCYGGKVIVLGNAIPTAPHSANSSAILKQTTEVMNTRHRCTTFYTSLLLKNIERLEQNSSKSNKAMEERYQRQERQIEDLQKENEDQRFQIKDLIIKSGSVQSDVAVKSKRLEQDTNDLKNLLMIRESEVADLKTRVRELEADIESRIRGVTTQYHYLSGHSEDRMDLLEQENLKHKARISELEVMVNALQTCLMQKRPGRDQETQCRLIDATKKQDQDVPMLSISTGLHLNIVKNSKTFQSLPASGYVEELRCAKAELEDARRQLALQVPRPVLMPIEGDDMTQSRALYKLLTECWIYLDSVVKSLRQIYDQRIAALEFKVADRELRVAYLDYRLAQHHRIHSQKLQELEPLSTEINALKTALQRAEVDFAASKVTGDEKENKLRVMFAEEMHTMKEKFKNKIKEEKNRTKTLEAQLTEQAEVAKHLQAELEEKEESMNLRQEQAEIERKELQRQLADLKELRKPLAPSNRK